MVKRKGKKPFTTPTNTPEYKTGAPSRTLVIQGNYRILETKDGFFPQKQVRRYIGMTWYLKSKYEMQWVYLDRHGYPQSALNYLQSYPLKCATLKEAEDILLNIACPIWVIHEWPNVPRKPCNHTWTLVPAAKEQDYLNMCNKCGLTKSIAHYTVA